MRDEVVHRDLNRLPLNDVVKRLQDQLVVEGVWTRGGGKEQTSVNAFSERASSKRAARRAAPVITRMVEVKLAFDRFGFLFRSEHFVETVLAQDGHLTLPVIDLVLPQHLHDLGTYRRLRREKKRLRQSWDVKHLLTDVCDVLHVRNPGCVFLNTL